MSLLQNSNAIESGGYPITNSLRFQSASSQYLSRTPASAGNQQKFTWSGWVKRGALGSNQTLISTSASLGSNSGVFQLAFTSNNTLEVFVYSTPTTYGDVITTQVFRDPSAWYHIVVTVDTTQATAANRIIVYVNGVQVTSYSTATYPSQNFNCYLNGTTPTYLGGYTASGNPAPVFDGYMTEINFIDGQALTPSSFGETNTLTGQWVAKKYTGTYGTNGFYLPFSNGTSTTTLGYDSSGNGNNWTLTNFTRSAGVSDCWMKDVPSGNGSSVSATQPNSNYAVLSPIDGSSQTVFSVSRANLGYTLGNTSTYSVARSTISVTSGKWYWEVIPSNTQGAAIGIIPTTLGYQVGPNAVGVYTYNSTGDKWANNVNSAYATAWAANDVIGFAYDADGGTLTVYKNNTSLGQLASGISVGTGISMAVFGGNNSATGNINFGQRSFAYTPPSGYKALCTANLPASTIVKGNKYMDATLYTGNGSSQNVVNASGFKPDLVWIKGRSFNYNNALYDSVRGTGKVIISNSTGAETGNTGDLMGAFNSNGFQVNTTYLGGTDQTTNNNTTTYVGWQWQAGQGTTSSNTSGSITSTVSVNATAGFSIVTFTAQTSGTGTIGHGLGVAPAFVITKQRASAGGGWSCYHQSIGNTSVITLNNTAAASASVVYWNNTSPTSSLVTLGSGFAGAGTMVAYCFAEIAGFSKFGSYTGNGSADGPFVFTNFQPKFVMVKNASAVADWYILDSVRNTYNVTNLFLYPDLSNAEATGAAGVYELDFLSNGFKIRGNAANLNGSTNTVIFAAFAESPFQNSNAR